MNRASLTAPKSLNRPTVDLPQTITEAIHQLPSNWVDLAYASFEGWVEASWEDFLAIAGEQASDGLPRTKGYYHNQKMHLAMVPLGYNHSRQNSAPVYVVSLYATFQKLSFIQCINATLRKSGQTESQPDLSIYIGTNKRLPSDSDGKVINLDQCDPPSLVVEIAETSLADDLGPKRSLYQDLGIEEYWVIDTPRRSLIAFDLTPEVPQELTISKVLPGLDLAIVIEALRRTDDNNDAATTLWLIELFRR